MRMWDVDPSLLCRKHLLGEHVEMHMFVGTIRKGISIQGYIDRGLVNPVKIADRHQELMVEMESRGYRHESPLPRFKRGQDIPVNKEQNLKELSSRCPECKARILG